jgi:hypothetical protein
MGIPLPLIVLIVCALGSTSAAENSDTMRATLLGTGTPFPNANRFGSAILVEAAGKRLLFDCGRGAVTKFRRYLSPVPAAIRSQQ